MEQHLFPHWNPRVFIRLVQTCRMLRIAFGFTKEFLKLVCRHKSVSHDFFASPFALSLPRLANLAGSAPGNEWMLDLLRETSPHTLLAGNMLRAINRFKDDLARGVPSEYQRLMNRILEMRRANQEFFPDLFIVAANSKNKRLYDYILQEEYPNVDPKALSVEVANAAALAGNEELFLHLCRKVPWVICIKNRNNTVLYHLAAKGHTELLRVFIQHVRDNARRADKPSLLDGAGAAESACRNDHVSVLQLLRDEGLLDPALVKSCPYELAVYAVRAGNHECVEWLLTNGFPLGPTKKFEEDVRWLRYRRDNKEFEILPEWALFMCTVAIQSGQIKFLIWLQKVYDYKFQPHTVTTYHGLIPSEITLWDLSLQQARSKWYLELLHFWKAQIGEVSMMRLAFANKESCPLDDLEGEYEILHFMDVCGPEEVLTFIEQTNHLYNSHRFHQLLSAFAKAGRLKFIRWLWEHRPRQLNINWAEATRIVVKKGHFPIFKWMCQMNLPIYMIPEDDYDPDPVSTLAELAIRHGQLAVFQVLLQKKTEEQMNMLLLEETKEHMNMDMYFNEALQAALKQMNMAMCFKAAVRSHKTSVLKFLVETVGPPDNLEDLLSHCKKQSSSFCGMLAYLETVQAEVVRRAFTFARD